MHIKHLVLAALAAGSLAGAAQAGAIGVGAFTAPVITGFGSPNPTAVVGEPLGIANYTFTSSGGDGLIWWGANGFNDCIGGCVTTSLAATGTSPYSLDVDLGGAFALAGLFVGQATAYSLDVSFFDAGHALLGTVNVAGAGDGVSFAGWESDLNKVASIQITNQVADNFVISAQSGYLQANGGVPEPASWALMIAGFGLAGAALRRRRGLAAA